MNEYINAIQKKCQASKDEVAVQIAKTRKNKDEVIGYFADKLKIDDSKGVTKKTTPQSCYLLLLKDLHKERQNYDDLMTSLKKDAIDFNEKFDKLTSNKQKSNYIITAVNHLYKQFPEVAQRNKLNKSFIEVGINIDAQSKTVTFKY